MNHETHGCRRDAVGFRVRRTAAEYVMGLDIGTSAVKAALFDVKGDLAGQAGYEYQLLSFGERRVELDPEVYWEDLCRVIRQLLQETGIRPQQVRALSLASQAETLICVDGRGRPTRRAIVWLDGRAHHEAEFLEREFGVESVYRTTGLPGVSATWPAPKILWIRRQEPDVFTRTRTFVIVKDYLLWRLTGRRVTEPTESSSTCYFRLQEESWWPEMLELIGIGRAQLPDIVGSPDVVGGLSSEARTATGLPKSTVVVAGAMDQMAAALGAGNVAPGVVTESTGTSLTVLASVPEPVFAPDGGVPCAPHCVPGMYVVYPYADTSGIVLKWFREGFAGSLGKQSYESLLRAAAKVAPGAAGLRALPHLTGTGCPDFNPHARGAFVGISLHHRWEHFVRALVESVAFLLRDNVELLRGLSVPVEGIRSIGGGARSDTWLQIKSDVLQLPLEVPQQSETALLGAALLAAWSMGMVGDLDQAVARLVQVKRRFQPETAHAECYERAYQEYRGLCYALYPPGGES